MTNLSLASARAVPSESGTSLSGVPKPDYYLHSEGVVVSPQSCTIMTILGSCVSVCLWDEATGAGGMNHFLLPHQIGRENRAGRFGSSAITLLIEKLEAIGCRRRDLRGKVFGGARIHAALAADNTDLGRRNVDVATAVLESEHILIVGQDVGGDHGRKVLFRTCDGAAWVRQIGDGANGTR